MEGKISIINNNTDLVVVDRINALPDSILGLILSFLPTKEAVATSILSKSWKFAWQTVHNLVLCYNYKDSDEARNEAEKVKFVRFVDRVLLLIDAGPLNKFSLVWDSWINSSSSHVSSWIKTAITRNVRELYLSLGHGQIFNIPLSGFNCDSLQSLELNENINVTSVMVCLPRLVNLKLDRVYFESEVVCEKLISGCPMLQSLYLDIYFMDERNDEESDTFSSVFTCDSLQSLELKSSIYVHATIVVCLPRLENLKLDCVHFRSKEACEKLLSGCPVIQSLYLDTYFIEDRDEEEFDTFSSVFTCDSLQSLELQDNIYVPAAIVVCLPRLENLKLPRVHFESEEACEKLISGCPMLSYLDLDIPFTNNTDDNNDYFTCIISSASLRHVDIYVGDRSRMKLKASSLEYLRLRGSISEIFVENGLSSLVHADFDISLAKHDFFRLDGHGFLNNSIVEAVRAFDCAKFLALSADVMWALSRSTISLSTEFTRLVRLKANTYCSSLQDLIQSSCNLEALIIDQDYWHYWQGTSDPRYLSSWNALVEVPRCLSNSLKEVHFYGYNGWKNEREMIRYMLKYGSVLEVMHISCCNDKGNVEKLKLLQEIRKFPRKSPVCKVSLQRGNSSQCTNSRHGQ